MINGEQQNLKLTKQLNLIIMKKSLFVAAFAALALVACKKTETVESAEAVDSTAAATADSAAAVVDSAAVVVDSAAAVATDAAATATEAAKK